MFVSEMHLSHGVGLGVGYLPGVQGQPWARCSQSFLLLPAPAGAMQVLHFKTSSNTKTAHILGWWGCPWPEPDAPVWQEALPPSRCHCCACGARPALLAKASQGRALQAPRVGREAQSSGLSLPLAARHLVAHIRTALSTGRRQTTSPQLI